MHTLQGAAVLITGASSGIGRETAAAFARRGARVAVAARRRERLESLAREPSVAASQILPLPVDLSDPEQVRRMVHAAYDHLGALDILINNAGYGLVAPLEETTPEEMTNLFAVNVFAPFLAIREAIPLMRRANHGHIINVASSVGRRAIPFSGAYSATKSALVGLSEALRLELAGSGIGVTTVFPVRTATEFFSVLVTRRALPYSGLGPLQPASRVADAIVRCALRPRPEVLPFPWLRLAFLLNAVSPRLVDVALSRVLRRR